MTDVDKLLTPGEVAALFRVGTKAVQRWAKAGKLTCVRTPGGHRRYRESEVRALLEPEAGGGGDVMTVSDQALADIIANLKAPSAVQARTTLGTCRATGCTERLDPILVDNPATGTGLHVMCAEPAVPGPAIVQPALDETPAAAPVLAEPASTVRELRQLLADHEANSARSTQRHIGPSEIGEPCQRALGYKLHNTPERDDPRLAWAPIQGTAVHAYIADVLTAHNTQLGRTRWLVEERVWPTPEISGSGDAFDLDTGTVIDWKLVGDSSLKKYAKEMRPEYRVQAHLYGLGHERAGRDVRWVRIVLLHRSHDYEKSWEWTERYDPEVAILALDRMYSTVDLLNSLQVGANPALWGVVPARPTPNCRYCRFYRPGRAADDTGCPGDIETNQARLSQFTKGLIA